MLCLLELSCPCKLCFKTAPGTGGCIGCAGAGGLLWDPGGIQPAGMCCAAGNLGRNVGGGHAGYSEEPVQRINVWKYLDTRRWAGGLHKGRKQEMVDGKMQGEKEKPAQVMLSCWLQEQEPGSTEGGRTAEQME